jgi:hypothetical protein
MWLSWNEVFRWHQTLTRPSVGRNKKRLSSDQWTRLHVRIVHPKWSCVSRRARQRPFSTAGALRGNLAFGGHIGTRTVIRRLHHQGMRARRPIKRPQLTTNRKWNLKLYTKKNQLSFANTNVEKYTWHFTHPVININKNRSITCFTGYIQSDKS